jgi:hypothetical protein
MLQDMGFSRIVSEKALFMVQGKGVPGAMDWIDKHREDADFEEELFIITEQPGGAGGNSAMSNLTKEEKIAKARELQKQIREKRMKEEAAQKEENDKARREADKELAK